MTCREPRRYTDILSAIEVALFGSASPFDSSDVVRLDRIGRACGNTAGSAEERIQRVLQCVALPPIVEISRPDGPRWVAFAPLRCYGSFKSQSEAAAALVPVVGSKARGTVPPPGVLPPRESLDSRIALQLSYLEAGAVAQAIGTHVRPVAEGEAGTGAAELVSKVPCALPRDHAALKDSGLWLALPARAPNGSETVEQIRINELPKWGRLKRTASVREADAGMLARPS